MPDDLASFLDELVGASEWDVCLAPPAGAPRFLMRFLSPARGVIYGPGVRLTGHSLERFLELKTGSPRVEAQGPDATKYRLVPIKHTALGWQYRRDLRRLTILDRERRELAVYYNPRIVADQQQEQVDAWVASELEAGETVKPDEPDTRARCSKVVGFEVGRQMLRDARRKFAARGRGRPGNREKPSN
jgi:hypothetical protein